MTTTKKRTKNAIAPTAKARVAKRSGSAAPLRTKPYQTNKILDLLKQPDGVTLEELVKATGWQPDSVRGFLSGTIGKKLAIPVESFKTGDGDRSYRLSGHRRRATALGGVSLLQILLLNHLRSPPHERGMGMGPPARICPRSEKPSGPRRRQVVNKLRVPKSQRRMPVVLVHRS
jgi:hypothetical protein